MYWTLFFNLNIYAHLCGHLLTLMCPFIILYALFFIKLKKLWIKNLISWQNFATLIYSKLQEPVSQFKEDHHSKLSINDAKQLNKGGNYEL